MATDPSQLTSDVFFFVIYGLHTAAATVYHLSLGDCMGKLLDQLHLPLCSFIFSLSETKQSRTLQVPSLLHQLPGSSPIHYPQFQNAKCQQHESSSTSPIRFFFFYSTSRHSPRHAVGGALRVESACHLVLPSRGDNRPLNATEGQNTPSTRTRPVRNVRFYSGGQRTVNIVLRSCSSSDFHLSHRDYSEKVHFYILCIPRS